MIHNESEHRFEITADGETAVLEYRLQPGAIVFVHTEVPVPLEGQGLGSRLASAGLEFARDKDLTVIPLCPFVSSYIARHPESPQEAAGVCKG